MSKGRNLAVELGIKCNQALYSEWGNFYAPISQYPCALFDKNGFVLVNSEEDCQLLEIKLGKRTNIPTLLSNLSGYQLIERLCIGIAEEIQNESISQEMREGAVETIMINRYERDRRGRSLCIDHYGYTCAACDQKLSELYGEVADRLIHVHHLVPLSTINAEYSLDPIHDLRPLCPNCHAVAHLRKNKPYSIEEIRAMLIRKTKI